jgi:DNA-directed RNA polymerase beta' subunit
MSVKRNLTKDEIEEILNFIKPQANIPQDIAKSIVDLTKNEYREQLRKQLVYDEIIPMLTESLEIDYYKSLIQPGENVGPIAAQSFGQKTTQTTLDTFHRCGMSESTMVTGVPRFKELLDVSTNPNMVNHKIYINKNNSSLEKIQSEVCYKLAGVKLKNVTCECQIHLEYIEEKWYKSYILINGTPPFELKEKISITLDTDKLYEINLSVKKIAQCISNKYTDLYCIYSPTIIGKFDIFVDSQGIELPSDRLLFINTENAMQIYIEECIIPNLENIYICGIPSIKDVFYTQDGAEWVVETNSSNSKKINSNYSSFKRLLAEPIVNMTKTTSNNVWDIFEVLGIEAARLFLIDELLRIMDGVNTCHAELLVDRMTHSGEISAITRYTLRKDEGGPLSKASFEETLDNLLKSSSRGEIEPAIGLSASLICGKKAEIGTGMVKLVTDMSKLTHVTHN